MSAWPQGGLPPPPGSGVLSKERAPELLLGESSVKETGRRDGEHESAWDWGRIFVAIHV